MKPPVSIKLDAAGPDVVLYCWHDSADKYIVRGAIGFPEGTGNEAKRGYLCVVVRPVSGGPADIVLEHEWLSIDPMYDETGERMVERGLMPSLIRAQVEFGCERFYHAQPEQHARPFIRSIYDSAGTRTPPGVRPAEVYMDGEGWANIWRWVNERKLAITEGTPSHRLLQLSESTAGMPLGPVGRALSAALWSLDRRGTRIEKVERRAPDHWRTIPRE